MGDTIEGFRLSSQQARLSLLRQDSPSYRVQYAVAIEGVLRSGALKNAVQIVVSRNEILRTTFHRVPGLHLPLQVINEANTFLWHEIDITNCATWEQEERVERLILEEQRYLFDIEHGPVLRLILVALAPFKHVLLISLPALCADTWTVNSIVRQIGKTYTSDNQDGGLGYDNVLLYIQYSEWQHELLESKDAEEGRRYWQIQDMTDLPLLSVPLETREPGEQTFAPQEVILTIDPDMAVTLEMMADRVGCGLATLLLACWQILLWRLVGRSELTVGVVDDGRHHEELEHTLGLFAKYLPVRCSLREGAYLRDIVRQIDSSLHSHHDWQEHFSWELYAEPLHMVTTQVQPYFPFCFDFEEQPGIFYAAGISWSIDRQHTCIDRFKVKLSCSHKRDGSIELSFYYDATVCNKDMVARMSKQFYKTLESLRADTETPIDMLEILPHAERERILVAFNDATLTSPPDVCLHHLFEQCAARAPHSIAVMFKDQRLTYADLDDRANQLARYLMTLGVASEVLVVVRLERSLELLIGLLGILKAGGAYLPVDPLYPAEGLACLLEETQAPIVLTQQRLRQDLPQSRAQVVCLDTEWTTISREFTAAPVSQSRPDNIAYVIYTSGSTGKPKGVMVSHRGLMNYLQWCVDAYAVADGQGALVQSSIGFDFTITSLFTPLLVGRTVHLLPEDIGVEGLTTALSSGNQYGLVKVTPSHLDILRQQQYNPRIANAAKMLIVGGEALRGDSLSSWRVDSPSIRIVNEYGPTETVVGCCTYEVSASIPTEGNIPIGRPIANTQVYVLDRHLQPVAIGGVGELYIGGRGLARGYLHRPSLTAERFVPHPFGRETGTRLYQTGDMTRFLSNGILDFIGRNDRQIKLRGYRIELGEIELVLSQHQSVQESTVLLHEDVPGDRRLVGYVVLHRDALATPGDLQTFLRASLPAYMVPSAFVFLEAMPLTVNGKIDHSALPAYGTVRPRTETEFVAPRTLTEDVLATIWANVLGLNRVSIYDNFFELGGHSLLATQLISRVQNAFRLQLKVRILFERPTIASLALAIAHDHREVASADDPDSSAGATLETIQARPELPLLIDVDQLSNREVEALLDALVRDEGRST